jgi:hypothetical protein
VSWVMSAAADSTARRCQALAASLLVALALILLSPIAFASPPDPSWVAGFYDDADGDDIVSLVYESSASNGAAVSHVAPLSSLTEASFASIVHRRLNCQSTASPRSPPTVAFSCLFNFSQHYTPSTPSFPRSTSSALITKSRLSGLGNSP